MELHKSKFSRVVYEPKKNFLRLVFFERTKEMSDVDFVNDIKEIHIWLKEAKPDFLLLNLHDFGFIVSSKLQKWTSENINYVEKSLCDKRTAIVKSKDISAFISISQILNEQTSFASDNYFSSEMNAKKWLFQKDDFFTI